MQEEEPFSTETGLASLADNPRMALRISLMLRESWIAHEHDETGWPTESCLIVTAASKTEAKELMSRAITAHSTTATRQRRDRLYAIFIEAPPRAPSRGPATRPDSRSSDANLSWLRRGLPRKQAATDTSPLTGPDGRASDRSPSVLLRTLREGVRKSV
jgi:hypothetical protein